MDLLKTASAAATAPAAAVPPSKSRKHVPVQAWKTSELDHDFRVVLLRRGHCDACVLDHHEELVQEDRHVTLSLTSHEGYGLTLGEPIDIPKCLKLTAIRLNACTGPCLEGYFDGKFIRVRGQNERYEEVEDMVLDVRDGLFFEGNDLLAVKFWGSPNANLKTRDPKAQGRHFHVDSEGTLSPASAPHLVVGLQANIVVDGPMIRYIIGKSRERRCSENASRVQALFIEIKEVFSTQGVPLTAPILRGLFFVTCTNVLLATFLAAVNTLGLYLFRWASTQNVELIAYFYIVGHQLLYPPTLAVATWTLMDGADPYVKNVPHDAFFFLVQGLTVGAFSVFWAGVAYWTASTLFAILPSTWLSNSYDTLLCMALCSVSLPLFVVLRRKAFLKGFPWANTIREAIVLNLIVQFIMFFMKIGAHARNWIMNMDPIPAVMFIAAFNLLKAGAEYLIVKAADAVTLIDDSWRYDAKVQLLHLRITDLFFYTVSFLLAITLKFLVTALPNALMVLITSCAMAIVELLCSKYLVYGCIAALWDKEDIELKLARACVSKRIAKYLVDTQLEYAVMGAAVAAAYLFNGSSVVTGFGGSANWNLSTSLEIIAAQFIPELIVDYASLILLARAGIHVHDFFTTIRVDPSLLLCKTLFGLTVMTMVVPQAFFRY